jgi:hypothetical protein
MSTFKYHRNNKHRYNIYESHIETIEIKSFYVPLRNTLLIIALILTLLVTSLISLDTYQNKKHQLKSGITKLELTKIISNNVHEDINPQQLKLIINNVMEKVENSPNQIIYTKS